MFFVLFCFVRHKNQVVNKHNNNNSNNVNSNKIQIKCAKEYIKIILKKKNNNNKKHIEKKRSRNSNKMK